jgi:hypothetical protein
VIAEGSGEVGERNGLLAVRIPRGEQRLTLIYRSRSFVAGCVLALIGAAFIVFLGVAT